MRHNEIKMKGKSHNRIKYKEKYTESKEINIVPFEMCLFFSFFFSELFYHFTKDYILLKVK